MADPTASAAPEPNTTAAADRVHPAWALQLEDGPLRREMGIPDRPPEAPAVPMVYQENLKFHGTGSEYFRIWVVHLFLTLITLGIYSAWAKVRKARWFAQNTSLGGDRFDYHGDPKRILLGRVVAVVLLAVWTLAFDLSPIAGLVVLVVFCIVGPLLFASGQRFRLVNTSWRGLRFGFKVPRTKLYMVCVPLLLIWTAGSVVQALGVDKAFLGVAGLATVIGLPWAHARLKQLQHHHANFGDQTFSFAPAGPEFYGLYAKAIGLAIVAGALFVPVMAVVATMAPNSKRMTAFAVVIGALVGVMMWVSVWPYFAARMQQIVWGHTKLGAVQFQGRMKGWPLWRLVMGQAFLTLITAGLYWPFAAVALARFRVQSISVESPVPLRDAVALSATDGGSRAAGDAAMDFFGLDLGW